MSILGLLLGTSKKVEAPKEESSLKLEHKAGDIVKVVKSLGEALEGYDFCLSDEMESALQGALVQITSVDESDYYRPYEFEIYNKEGTIRKVWARAEALEKVSSGIDTTVKPIAPPADKPVFNFQTVMAVTVTPILGGGLNRAEVNVLANNGDRHSYVCELDYAEAMRDSFKAFVKAEYRLIGVDYSEGVSKEGSIAKAILEEHYRKIIHKATKEADPYRDSGKGPLVNEKAADVPSHYGKDTVPAPEGHVPARASFSDGAAAEGFGIGAHLNGILDMRATDIGSADPVDLNRVSKKADTIKIEEIESTHSAHSDLHALYRDASAFGVMRSIPKPKNPRAHVCGVYSSHGGVIATLKETDYNDALSPISRASRDEYYKQLLKDKGQLDANASKLLETGSTQAYLKARAEWELAQANKLKIKNAAEADSSKSASITIDGRQDLPTVISEGPRMCSNPFDNPSISHPGEESDEN